MKQLLLVPFLLLALPVQAGPLVTPGDVPYSATAPGDGSRSATAPGEALNSGAVPGDGSRSSAMPVGWEFLNGSDHLEIAPGGAWTLASDSYHQRFVLVGGEGDEVLEVSGSLTGGRMASWSPDGRYVGFKIVQETSSGSRIQVPALLDVQSREVLLLSPPAALAGNPSFSASGQVGFTVGQTLYVLDQDLHLLNTEPLPAYANRIALSPGGHRVLYNENNDTIFELDLRTGQHRRVSPEGIPCCCPLWSPDGAKILLSTLGGDLLVVDVATRVPRFLGPGDDATWADEGRSILASERILQDEALVDIRLVRYDLLGARDYLPVPDGFWPRMPSLDRVTGQLVFRLERRPDLEAGFYRARLEPGGVLRAVEAVDVPHPTYRVRIPRLESGEAERSSIIYITGVPFHHQIYCTPADFDGSGACGAASATMAIAYYGRFEPWDFVAETPFAHTSHYGNYVSEIYTWGDFTFDIYGSGSSYGGYGGNGYIWQEPVDTKTHMMEYFTLHDLQSDVDWSPTWDKVLTEVDAGNPFVVLTAITSSGHYQTVLGYHAGQHTVYVNDPYGNKNEGYTNFNGAGVSYDWPGYNNGYSNLEAVYCYIYARALPPPDEPGTVDNPIVISRFPYSDSDTTRSSGGTDLFDYYNCAPDVDERGREKTYVFTVQYPGVLSASVDCDEEVDIDLHLLDAPDDDACLTRAHISFSQWIDAGTYWLVCDTFRSSGTELMGDYTLQVSFTPDFMATPTPDPDATPEPPIPGCGVDERLFLQTGASFGRE